MKLTKNFQFVGASVIAMLANTTVANTKPNYVIILLDDMGYADLSCTGARGYKTLNIDKNDMWPNHPTYKFYPDLPLIEKDSVIELNPDQTQFTKRFTERAVSFINKNKKKPFFLYLAHPMPHVPISASERYKGKSDQGLYGDVMMELDWSVGEILSNLKKFGLDKNTLVVFTSDNGPWLSFGNHAGSTGGLREGKGTSWEGGQRVPCVMYWKDVIPSGQICNKLASTIDLPPTFAGLSGAPLPAHKIDGVGILPLLKGNKQANPRKNFLYYYKKNSLEAVTDGRWKLVFPHKFRTYEKNQHGQDGAEGRVSEGSTELMLYDLSNDPGERYDVKAIYPDIVAKLQVLANEAREDLGDDLTNNSGKNRRAPGKFLQE